MSVDKKLIEKGILVADANIYERDKIWSRYSNDKVEIGEGLALIIRFLNKALPLDVALRALSIGSSAEPQFRILESAFLGGLYLLDVEKEALEIVQERIHRQHTSHVTTLQGDFNKIFLSAKTAKTFFKMHLGSRKVHLVTLHHSLYYAPEAKWLELFEKLWRFIMAPQGMIHAVLMASESNNSSTTTWLYNHFAGKFFGHFNDQDLNRLMRKLRIDQVFSDATIVTRPHTVLFWVDDFEKFMAVVWMILLHPDVHRYTDAQKEEITEFIYKKFWRSRRPLVQLQDHALVRRGIHLKGLSLVRHGLKRIK